MDEPAIHQDSKPLVSVIVPIYNISQYVDRCVESILVQTYRELEVLLIDDGSADDSGAVCDAWALRDQRVSVIHKCNGGLSSARNAGIDAACGEYVLFVDGDDYINPQMVSAMIHRAFETEADIVIAGFSWVDGAGTVLRTEQYSNTVMTPQAFWQAMYPHAAYPDGVQAGFFVVAWNKLYKRRIFLTERFDEGRLHEDEFILHRLINGCKVIATLEGCYYYYVQRSGSITHRERPSSILDAAEAIMNRSAFLMNQGMSFESLVCCADVATTLSRIPSNLSDECLQSRANSIKNRLIAQIEVNNTKILNRKSKLKLFLFQYTPALYRMIVKLKRRSGR